MPSQKKNDGRRLKITESSGFLAEKKSRTPAPATIATASPTRRPTPYGCSAKCQSPTASAWAPCANAKHKVIVKKATAKSRRRFIIVALRRNRQTASSTNRVEVPDLPRQPRSSVKALTNLPGAIG